MIRNYENPAASEWYKAVLKDLSQLPVSFVYDNKEYRGLGSRYFSVTAMNVRTVRDKETCEITLDFKDGIKITLIMAHCFSHGATEWTLWFENTSGTDSKIIKDIKTVLTFKGERPVLKGILGDHVNKYSPYSIDLSQNYVEFSSDSGRATHINFPYFNLEYGECGVMLAIGWAGTWRAEFATEKEVTTYTASSVNGLETYLKAGEKIRTALFVSAPYTVRNEHFATNYWRDWFINYNLPKSDASGIPLTPFSTCCLASDTGLPNSDGSISERFSTWKPSLEKMIKERVKVDFRWFDAGWYVCPDRTSPQPFVKDRDWWATVGTWELDAVKWPDKTFLESTEFARENGMKTLVWFEPERVSDPENLAKNFGYNTDWAIRVEGQKAISNNIGNPECFEWTVNRVCKMLYDNKVELYREDNNCNPLPLWNHLDGIEGENRRGITECKFIDGHYRLWDRIIECTSSYGGCAFVDSCASGGGRNDLESMRRGVPLLRSDSDRTSTALRLSMTASFNKWLPFCGANTKEKLSELAAKGVSDEYVWRASYLPALNVDSQFVYDETNNFDILRFGLSEWKKVAPFLLKEFYPLTPWHKEADTSDFTAFCYFDPKKEEGVILAFRQEKCERDTLKVKLPFIQNNERYNIIDNDSKTESLTDGMLQLYFNEKRTARLLWIKKALET